MQTEVLETQSYLTFRLDDEIFAASVSHVIEILELTRITRVPRSPEFMRGVINLRGSVLPVIDTRLKFGLPKAEDTVNTCIMVLNVESEGKKIMLGAIVDAVREVMEITEADIQPAPSIGARYKSEFLNGMVKSHDQFIMMLNIQLVFTTDEMSLLQEVSNTQN